MIVWMIKDNSGGEASYFRLRWDKEQGKMIKESLYPKVDGVWRKFIAELSPKEVVLFLDGGELDELVAEVKK